MFLHISAKMKKLIRDGAQLNADTGTFIRLSELLNQVRVFQEGKTVADTLGLQKYCVVKVRVLGVARAARVEQGLASVKHEGNLDIELLAGLLESEELFFVKSDVPWPIFSAHEVKA